ncbi:MAG: hypothetical protein K9N52_11420 [Verrucomicrobia bacterium]|nr:hypothetical protein [Verrucomicrobiota bacterium]
MRTKTLFLTAALGAASMICALAQEPVYSVNVVGYVNVDVPAGFSIVANPLDNKDGNMLSNLIPDTENGAMVYKYDPASGFVSSTYFMGSWSPDLELQPGEGAFVNVSSPTTITFVGEVMQGDLSVELPAGFSLVASQVPQSIKLEDMNFPAENGDMVYFFRDGNYSSSTFFMGGFSPEATPSVGEGFFVNKGSAATWSRSFSVE